MTKWPKFSFLDYYEPKLALVSQEIMSLPFPTWPRSISLENNCQERYYRNFTAIPSFLDVKNQTPKTDLKKSHRGHSKHVLYFRLENEVVSMLRFEISSKYKTCF